MPKLPGPSFRSALPFAIALVVLLTPAGPLHAQVTYVRDIPLPSAHQYVSPLFGISVGGGFAADHLLHTNGPFLFQLLQSTSPNYVPAPPLSSVFKVNLATQVAFHDSENGRFLFETGPPARLCRNDFALGIAVCFTRDIAISANDRNTLASNDKGSVVAGIASGSFGASSVSNQLYRLDLIEAAAPVTQSTLLIGTNGTGPGEISTIGRGAFGPGPASDALFYLLDDADGVKRVQAFDVTGTKTEAERFKGSFVVSSSLSLTAGLAVGPTGHVYIGDGLGGLSEYDLNGNHITDVTFAGAPTPDLDCTGTLPASGLCGSPFLNLDHNGYIYVYTPETGLHQYFDPSFLPRAVIVDPVTGQYSDQVTLSATVTPAAAGNVEFITEFASVGSAPVDPITGVATLPHVITRWEGSYPIVATYWDATGVPIDGKSTLTVTREDASVTPDPANTAFIPISGTATGPFTLSASAADAADGFPGDICAAGPLTVTLAPIYSGTTYHVDATLACGSATASFDNVAQNVYLVTYDVAGIFYKGSAKSLLTVSKTSELGFATGGGRFLHGTVPAEFGFYARRTTGTPVLKMAYLEHRASGDLLMKSNVPVGQPVLSAGSPKTASILGTLTAPESLARDRIQLNVTDAGASGDAYKQRVTLPPSFANTVPSLTFDFLAVAAGGVVISP